MGHRREKNEICRGKTFRRAGGKSLSHQKVTSACVTKRHSSDISSIELSEFFDPRVSKIEDDIPYSLNKKGRWKLPEMITNGIQLMRYLEEPVNVSLLERHNLNRQANCVRYISSAGPKAYVSPNTTYFNESCLLPRKGGKGRKRRKSRDAYPETVKTCPEIRYDICYPSPRDSSVTYNKKYNPQKESVFLLKNSKGKTGSKHRTQLTTLKYLSEYMLNDDDYDQPSDDDVDDRMDVSDDQSLEGTPADQFTETNSDVISNEAVTGRLNHVGLEMKKLGRQNGYAADNPLKLRAGYPTAIPKTRYGKGCAIYLDEPVPVPVEPDTNKLGTTQTNNKRQTRRGRRKSPRVPRMIEATAQLRYITQAQILVPSGEITPDSLAYHFSDRYLEGTGNPRQFALDVSSNINRCIAYKNEEFDFSAWLIFVAERLLGENLTICRVLFNSELGVLTYDDRISTLPHMGVFALRDIVEKVVLFAENYIDSRLLRQSLSSYMRATASRPRLTFETLKSLKSWETEFYHSSEAPGIGWRQTNQALADAISNGNIQRDTIIPEDCPICLGELVPPEATTSLKSCGHVFCNSCWREHIQTQMKLGFTQLSCPEFGCASGVDHVTVLNFIPYQQYKTFLSRCHDNAIRKKRLTTKWCPNSKCGRIITNKGSTEDAQAGMCVTCFCGLSFCFKCLKDSHWPATCDQTKAYMELMAKLGDGNDTPDESPGVLVRVKFCPKCGEAIDKLGGCPNMVCVCGHNFCWNCLAKFHGYTNTCKEWENGDKKNTKKRYVREEKKVDETTIRSPLYLISLKHREYRFPRELKKFNQKALKLKEQLKTWAYKRRIATLSPVKHDVCNSVEDTRKEVDILISDIVKLTTECDCIIEHTAVLLEAGCPGENNSTILKVFYRLQFILSRIREIINADVDQNKNDIFARLRHLESCAKSCIGKLAAVLN